ncbi:ABC transporter permease [Psychroserpens sp.]|uniref:ABC transporter permease n=1 Tax=Psychroserpens sp. TaxID=2020870 RepID=UPI001B007D9D|nr:DUF3526 domain-containing protein [Psychroserpens sp.]MBO6607339.1 DUF3526 domain-containing protein [Psychroserpens sp.]MBO6654585.1 DUF3526 domain-containing protein [Psychroserpens sp.]MBO6681068.1 DUF3526 domain-containing protein [Psychroserpens sp.]MBO6749977.1 DUF3526 domain-containing protein [Psychroserpens sp.]MBO6916037.1 DUF3526 domain-containing protein [Psychroserpens sp.]
MKRIIINEWRLLYRNKTQFGIMCGFMIVVIVAIFLSHKQYNVQYDSFNSAKNELRAQWENIDAMNPHSAAHYGTYVFKPANLLTHLDEGVNSITGNVLRVEGHVQNEMVHSEASQMMFTSKFGKLKASLIFQYIIPLLLIFSAFASVYSEKQNDRLKLIVLQGISPNRIMFSKALAIWLYSNILLIITLLVYLIFSTSNLSSDLLLRLVLFFVSYSLYYFIIIGLTIFLSARINKTAIALTSMIGIWMLWTVFIPSMVLSSVEDWHPLPSRNAFKSAMSEDRSKGIDGHNPSDERGKALETKVLSEYGVDSLSQLPINFDGIRMQEDEEYGNLVWDKHFGNLNDILQDQKNTVQYFGIINPFTSLQNASIGLAGSDNLHHQMFLRQVEDYRRVFIKALNDEHAYGGSKTGDWGWKANNDFFKSVADFDYQPIMFKTVLKHYLLDICLLILWTGIVIVLIIFGTNKIAMT